MPRVVEDQLGKFKTDPLFKQLQAQSEVSICFQSLKANKASMLALMHDSFSK
jgi:hypothetical protein